MSNKTKCKKMGIALRPTQNVYKERCLSIQTKLRHYDSVLKPECLYGTERLVLNRKGDIEEIYKRERKIIRKIPGPKQADQNTYRLIEKEKERKREKAN